MPYEPIIAVGPRVNEQDLGNGFYTQLAKPSALDDDYRNKLAWLGEQVPGLPKEVRLIAQSQSGDITTDSDGTPALPTVIAFGFGADESRHDATQLDIFPHVIRVQLYGRYVGVVPNDIVMYEPPKPPQPDGKPSPIGAKWPEKGPNAYRPSVDNPTASGYAVGDKYTDATGTYQLDKQWWGWLSFSVWLRVG